MIIKSLVGSTNKEAIAAHQQVVDGWKSAIERAEIKTAELGQALTVHVNGTFVFKKTLLTLSSSRRAYLTCRVLWFVN